MLNITQNITHKIIAEIADISSVTILCVDVLLSLPTISLNVLVIWAVKAKFYLRKQKACVLLACLAVTDLLVGAVVLPLAIASHVERLVGSGPSCLLEVTLYSAVYIACVGSLFHLAIISGERYVAIKHALRYETLVTARRLTTVVAGAWASSLISLVTMVAFLGHDVCFVAVSLAILGLLAVITFCQVAIFLESRRHHRHIQNHQISQAAAKEVLKQNKAARTTSMILGSLGVCYVPQLVYTVIFIGEHFPKQETLCTMYAMDVLLYFNSLMNPLIYCIRTRDFRRAFRELFNLTNSQENAELEMQPVGDLGVRNRARNSQTHVEPLHKTTRTAWRVRTRLRESRTRSLDEK